MGYRYIGSKDRLAETLINTISQHCPNAHSVIDLMAGTGLFSLALRKHGCHDIFIPSFGCEFVT